MPKPITLTPDEEAAVQAALAEHDSAIAAASDLTLAGGNAQADELQAALEEDERRSGRLDEQNAREIGRLKRELEQTQEFIRQMMEAGRGVGQIGGAAAAAERRKVHDAMINAMIAGGGRVTILIHPDPNPNHNWPVPVGINGETILIRRGVPTGIPVEFVGVLENARTEERTPLLDANDNPIAGGVTIDHLSYPYSLLPGAHPEENLLPQWHGRVDHDLQRGANQPRVNL